MSLAMEVGRGMEGHLKRLRSRRRYELAYHTKADTNSDEIGREKRKVQKENATS